MTGNWYMFETAEGQEAVGVELRRIHPLLRLQVIQRMQAERPAVPVVEQRMPDGTVQKQPNRGDPAYKEKLTAFEKRLGLEIANALLAAGVVEASHRVLDGRTPEELGKLVAVLEQRSYATESGVSALAGAVPAILVEGLLAGRFFEVAPRDYLAMDKMTQELLIYAYRQVVQAPTPRQRMPLPPSFFSEPSEEQE